MSFIKNSISKESKTFSSLEEAKEYLKEKGLSDEEIKKIDEDLKSGKKKSTSVEVNTSKTFSGVVRKCSSCKKTISSQTKNCPYCGTEIKIPFWKKILGI